MPDEPDEPELDEPEVPEPLVPLEPFVPVPGWVIDWLWLEPAGGFTIVVLLRFVFQGCQSRTATIAAIAMIATTAIPNALPPLLSRSTTTGRSCMLTNLLRRVLPAARFA